MLTRVEQFDEDIDIVTGIESFLPSWSLIKNSIKSSTIMLRNRYERCDENRYENRVATRVTSKVDSTMGLSTDPNV